MTRSILTAKSELNQAMQHAKIARAIVKANIDSARLLIDEDDLRELKAAALEAATALATIESYLGSFTRVSVSSKKFAVAS
jgi:hypothetical protein